MNDEPRKSAFLLNLQQGHGAMLLLWDYCKPWLAAGHEIAVRVGPKRRTDGQNERFHAICGDIAKSGIPWAGKARDAKAWKVLLISGHSVVTKEGAEMIPGLEGEFVNIRESSAQMSVRRGASLIEYATAYAVSNGVKLNDPKVSEPA